MDVERSWTTESQTRQIDHSSRAAGGSSSKFRGVLWLNSGKWCAQISYKYKPYCLRTYDVEEEAAMAYDRAAIKLQRSDAPLNFPMAVYTVQETKFQSQYSNEEILDMIKDKTYISQFTYYIRSQSLVRDFEASNLTNQWGIVYQALFQKELTQTDITHTKGFHIPKEYAMQSFPPLDGSNETGDECGSKSIELTFYDKHYRPWTFWYSYWKSTQTFAFTKGWRPFVKMNNLNQKDVVCFYRCECQGELQGRVFYMIDINRHSLQFYALGWNAEKEISETESAKNSDDDVESGAKNKEIKLFGAQIGERKPNNQPFFEVL